MRVDVVRGEDGVRAELPFTRRSASARHLGRALEELHARQLHLRELLASIRNLARSVDEGLQAYVTEIAVLFFF